MKPYQRCGQQGATADHSGTTPRNTSVQRGTGSELAHRSRDLYAGDLIDGPHRFGPAPVIPRGSAAHGPIEAWPVLCAFLHPYRAAL